MTDDASTATPAQAARGELGRSERATRAAAVARTVARVAGAAAALAVAVAVGVNWYSYRAWAGATGAGGGSGSGVAARPAPKLEKPPIQMLPSSVIAYETLARHGVPGRSAVSAEAIYATLNMELDVQVPVSVYANVEGFASVQEARDRLATIMAPQTVRAEDVLVNGVTPAKTGFNTDESAWFVGWVRGTYCVYVKSSFKDIAPFEKRDFLRNVSRPVIDAIDVFQRTGQQGLQRAPGAGAATSTTGVPQ